jgi:RimJ/RimL family protein N-acetyltransferase
MKPLTTERLIMRRWEDSDRALFHEINSDDRVMAFFPWRRDRDASDALMDEFNALIDSNGLGFAAVELKMTGETIGFIGITPTPYIPHYAASPMEIGWRLAHRFWGQGYATEGARAWLDHAFENLKLPEIVSYAVRSNDRSLAVMERLGMRPRPEHDFNNMRVSDANPHLKPHRLYTLSRQEWQDKGLARGI